MSNGKLPAWFWIVAVIAVLWNLMGVGAYIADVTMTEEVIAGMSDAERALREATPAWVVGAYAIAVFAGIAAAIALCLRRKVAVVLFVVSLAAVILQMGYVFGVMGAADVLGTASMIFPGIIILLSALQLWFSASTKKRGWLA